VVAGLKQSGSRREQIGNLLSYALFLRRTRPDVIHVQHPLERQRLVRIVERVERMRTPVVVTAHSLFGEHPECIIHNVMGPNLCSADAVIAVSPHIAAQAETLGVRPERIHVVRSGVDVERFQPRDREAARSRLRVRMDENLVLFVGNLEPRKQVDVLLRALPESASLVIIGTGENAGRDDQTEQLHALTRALGLQDRVRFVGRVPDSKLLEWYAAADVFALPSSSEAQGIAALEAMACGLPVVASAVGGLLGTIDNGRTGYLVPAGEFEALRDRLQFVLANPAHAREIGAAARTLVTERFTWARAVEQTAAVYREVLGG
jgi:glycosyltransferase involved in cell wall biosynthesis